MKKAVLLVSAVIIVLVLMLVLGLFGFTNHSLADVSRADQTGTFDEGDLIELAQTVGGSDEVPPTFGVPNAPDSPNAEPTRRVYFAPQDNDANATVVMLYNTTPITHTVTLKGYDLNGNVGININIAVGPSDLIHLVSDALAASPPPSWANSLITNFTDFTTYATLDIPQGIKVDGYVLFNPGSGTVDPRADQGAIILRFSADPLTLFMPGINHSP